MNIVKLIGTLVLSAVYFSVQAGCLVKVTTTASEANTLKGTLKHGV